MDNTIGAMDCSPRAMVRAMFRGGGGLGAEYSRQGEWGKKSHAG